MLQKLGEGGMGEVWEAEQQHPVRRRVALKLIKIGMDTEQVVARFEAERQALALMNHPSVARVFDAGATALGRPYFAMECVRGEPITRYCDRHRLSTRERLELFIRVCEGVQHAHQKGIIHRDLKPSNVMVTIQDNDAVPKIIDFGVAKATEQRLTEKTVFTQMGVLLGTPEYMSPEQAEMTGLDVDTRTDVYSLGVMLYELMVGALPFDAKELRRGGFDDLRQKIREQEPSKPSARVSTLGGRSTASAERRRTDLPTLRRQLRGDLDWITMKALEKDRTRRYDSAAELAADIRRHLRNEPVSAGPPGAAYRAGKFVRRHRLGVAAAGLVLLALVIGIAAAAYGLARAKRAEALARQDALRAQASNLYALGQNVLEDDPSAALAYAMASLERADTADVREFAVQVLWRGPTAFAEHVGQDALFLDFSPDGRWLAAGGWQGLHKLWRQDGSPSTALTEHGGDEAVLVGFSGDNRSHVSASGKGVRLWSLPQMAETRFVAIEPPAWNLSLQHNGLPIRGTEWLAVSDTGDRRGHLVQWWPLEGGEPRPLGYFRPPQGSVVDLDPDGEWIAYSDGPDLYVLALDELSAANARRIGSTGGEKIDVVTIHPDGDRIATLDAKAVIRIWSRKSQSTAPLRIFEDLEPGGHLLGFDRGGAWMISVNMMEKTTYVWDLSAPPDTAPLVLRRGKETYGMFGLAVHPAGTWIAIADTNTVSIWPLGRRYARVRQAHASQATSLVVDPDGEWLASAAWDGTLRLWPLSAAGDLRPRVLFRAEPMIDAGDVSPDGEHIVASLWNGSVVIVPLSGEPVRRLSGFRSALCLPIFDREGRRVAAAGGIKLTDDAVIRVWDLETEEVTLLDAGDGKEILSLDFTPDGRLLSGGRGGVRLWDVEAGTHEQLIEAPAAGKLDPSGRYYLARRWVDPERTDIGVEAFVYDLEQGVSRDLPGHGTRVFELAWHPSGSVVTGSTDGPIRIGPPSGEEPHLLLGHEGQVRGLAVLPDGDWIASAGDDGTVRLWPVPQGPPFHTLEHAELLERLRALTNYRVVRNDDAITGFRLDLAPFPGWERVPTW